MLLLEGENPYKVYLDGDPNKSIIKAQAPNYAHAIYIVLAPFGMMDWETAKITWAIFNVLVGIVTAIMLTAAFELSSKQSVFVLLIFLASTPFRNGVGNGQHGLLMLFAFTAMVQSSRYWSSLTAGCGYFKYSFAPPFAAYLLFNRGSKHLLTSLLPGVLGFALFWSITGGSFWETLIYPLSVSSSAVGAGRADLMTVTEAMTQEGSWSYLFGYYGLPIIFTISGSYFAAYYIKSFSISFSFICVLSLLLFKHLSYDFVFLLPSFCIAIRYVEKKTSKYILAIILFVWFGWKLIYEIGSRIESIEWILVLRSPYLSFLLMIGLAVSLAFLEKDVDPSEG